MRIALKSALMLTTNVIQIINPDLHRHMQRTALIALTLAQRLGLPAERQQTIFAPRCCTISAYWVIDAPFIRWMPSIISMIRISAVGRRCSRG